MAVNLMEALGAAEQAIQDRITIYIPSRGRNGEPVEFENWIGQAMELLSQIGGDATRMPAAQGAWLNPETDALIVEDVAGLFLCRWRHPCVPACGFTPLPAWDGSRFEPG
jgi:hypothetical protein